MPSGLGILWSSIPPSFRWNGAAAFATWSGQKLSGPMSEELNLGAAAEEEDERRGCRRDDGRIGFLIPFFSLSQKKSPRNGEVVKGDFAAAATEVDGYFGTRREGIPSFRSRRRRRAAQCRPCFGPANHEPIFLMGDSPNRTLHVVSTLFPPAQGVSISELR